MVHTGNVMITGTSTGIGKATALHLDRLGFRVFASVRKECDADALRAGNGNGGEDEQDERVQARLARPELRQAVALNPRYRAHELAYILKQADVTTLLLTDHLGPVDFLDTLDDVLPGLMQTTPGELAMENFPLLRRVIVDAEDPYPGCLRLSDVLDFLQAQQDYRTVQIGKAAGLRYVYVGNLTGGALAPPVYQVSEQACT